MIDSFITFLQDERALQSKIAKDRAKEEEKREQERRLERLKQQVQA